MATKAVLDGAATAERCGIGGDVIGAGTALVTAGGATEATGDV